MSYWAKWSISNWGGQLEIPKRVRNDYCAQLSPRKREKLSLSHWRKVTISRKGFSLLLNQPLSLNPSAQPSPTHTLRPSSAVRFVRPWGGKQINIINLSTYRPINFNINEMPKTVAVVLGKICLRMSGSRSILSRNRYYGSAKVLLNSIVFVGYLEYVL